MGPDRGQPKEYYIALAIRVIFAQSGATGIKTILIITPILQILYRIWFQKAYLAGPRSVFGTTPNSRAGGPGYDTRSGHILSFPLPLIQEGQLSVTIDSLTTS